MLIDQKERTLFPLSVTQKDFLGTEKAFPEMAAETGMLVIGTFYYVKEGSCDPAAMKKAYREVLRRNQSLRMACVHRRFRTCQFFREAEEFPEPEVLYIPGDMADITAFCRKPDSIPAISVSDPFLVCARILIGNDGRGGILIWTHHICSDGYTLGYLLYKQLCEFYDAYAKGEEPAPPVKEYLFTSFIKQEKEMRKKKPVKNALWCFRYFTHNHRYYNVPVKSDVEEAYPKHISIPVSAERYRDFTAFCREKGVSDNAVVMSAAAAVIYSVYGTRRFQMTSESHGRITAAQRQTTGPLLRTLPLFFDFPYGDTVLAFVKKVTKDLIQAARHMYYSENEEYFLMLPNYISSRTGPDMDEWMGFNNLRAYHSTGKSVLDFFMVEQPGIVNALEMDIYDGADGILLDFQYLEKVIPDSDAMRLAEKTDRSLNMILYHSDCSAEEWAASLRE